MAVSSAMVGYVSPFTVADGTAFPSALYNYYEPVAEAMLEAELNGTTLATAVYDHCHALLIAHCYAVKGGETALKSLSSGDLSWSKDPGVTPFLLEARAIIAGEAAAAAATATDSGIELSEVQRADADMGNLKLDRTVGPSYWTVG